MTLDPAEYVLRVLLGGDGGTEQASASRIHYGQARTAPKEAVIVIEPSGFFERSGTGGPQSLPTLPLKDISGVPLLFGTPKIEQKTTADGIKRLVTSADIVASAFFLLTRYEELARPDVRDEHGRFPGVESLPHRAGFLQKPVVDEYRVLLRGWLKKAGVEVEKRMASMTVALTHDVDHPYLYETTKMAIYSTIRLLKKDPKKAWRPIPSRLGIIRDPYDTFDWLMETDGTLQNALGRDRVKSLYFMMACEAGPNDVPYRLGGQRMRRLMRKLRRSGATLGIHPSYAAGGDPARNLAREKRTLERACKVTITHNRNHFLRWREPEDVKWIEKAGIIHDYTLGYADQVGFRLGTCRPVRFYNAVEKLLTRVSVHPLAIMDVSLLSDVYMALQFSKALEVCLGIAGQVARYNGELVLLWHNTGLCLEGGDGESDAKKLYRELVDNLKNIYGQV